MFKKIVFLKIKIKNIDMITQPVINILCLSSPYYNNNKFKNLINTLSHAHIIRNLYFT